MLVQVNQVLWVVAVLDGALSLTKWYRYVQSVMICSDTKSMNGRAP